MLKQDKFNNSFDKVSASYRTLQEKIYNSLETLDGKASFSLQPWQKKVGSGISGNLTDGNLIEKGAVHFSKVSGPCNKSMCRELKVQANAFRATGISSILHPAHPLHPIIHFNVRYLIFDTGLWWFGGGMDLTPHYVDPIEAHCFHKHLQEICNRYEPNFYHHFKTAADDYFYLPHRYETRGIGGIFFDQLNADCGLSFGQLWDFTINLSEIYVPVYAHFLQKNHPRPTQQQIRWQEIRRGRYAEFNLIYDRGTRFGLLSGGRQESILSSLPPRAQWSDKCKPKQGTAEAETLKWLRKGINWNQKEITKNTLSL